MESIQVDTGGSNQPGSPSFSFRGFPGGSVRLFRGARVANARDNMTFRFLRALAAGLALAIALPACEGEETADEQNATAATGRFETFVGDDGQHYFQLLAKNGE